MTIVRQHVPTAYSLSCPVTKVGMFASHPVAKSPSFTLPIAGRFELLVTLPIVMLVHKNSACVYKASVQEVRNVERQTTIVRQHAPMAAV